MKAILTSLILIIGIFANAQSTLEVNKNPNASELTAFISNDTLKLSGENLITTVDIFGEGFSFEKHPWRKKVEIDLKELPNGSYLLNAVTNGKMVIMTLHIDNPKKEAKKRVVIYIPYNISTTKVRKDHMDSDTIYIKETREMYIRRMDSIKGIRKYDQFKEK